MKEKSLYRQIIEGIADACQVWRDEMKNVFRDEGALLFFILLPLGYPLLYSWIYNNEVVSEVPVAVVDNSHSQMSRQFARMCDASPDVKVACYASDLDEAKKLMGEQAVKGIYYIPSDFAEKLNRMEQSPIVVYCDMSLMLAYKAVYQTSTAVTSAINSKIQIKLSGNKTDREDEITTAPLTFQELAMFNPSGGYGSFILPAVLVLIIQQVMLLGVGLLVGTAREESRMGNLVPTSCHYQGTFRLVVGKSMCYFMIFAVLTPYLILVVPKLFSFPTLGHGSDLVWLMLPYLLSCIFFAMAMSCMVRYRENVLLVVVFTSVPFLFLSGVSWPQSAMPAIWQAVAWLFPSTFGIRGYVRIESMGATLSDVAVECRALWIQTACYFVLACGVYSHQISESHRVAIERLEKLRAKQQC